eukprot:scaffold285872_cov13-Tisochrysis_lutea.AAC.1
MLLSPQVREERKGKGCPGQRREGKKREGKERKERTEKDWRDGKGKDKKGRERMGWEEMGRDGKGWEGMGREGKGETAVVANKGMLLPAFTCDSAEAKEGAPLPNHPLNVCVLLPAAAASALALLATKKGKQCPFGTNVGIGQNSKENRVAPAHGSGLVNWYTQSCVPRGQMLELDRYRGKLYGPCAWRWVSRPVHPQQCSFGTNAGIGQ